MSAAYDRRVTAARPDLAGLHLKGVVAAERYVEGRIVQVARGAAELRSAPARTAALETELLFGETFTVYEIKDGWAWGQAALDAHVGYAPAEAFGEIARPPTHRVSVRATPLLNAPDVKQASQAIVPMNAKLHLVERGERFSRLVQGGYVFSGHVAPVTARAADWVAVAETFLGAPYLWGGKTFAGIDCSGLVQVALEAAGIAAPRDTDLMEAALGHVVSRDAALKRGDLIFWKGHMGAMLDGARLIHASGSRMQVVIEDLAAACARVATDGLPVRAIKRIEPG